MFQIIIVLRTGVKTKHRLNFLLRPGINCGGVYEYLLLSWPVWGIFEDHFARSLPGIYRVIISYFVDWYLHCEFHDCLFSTEYRKIEM